MISRNNALTAATLAAGASLVALPAAATTAGAVAQHQAVQGPSAAWLGRLALSSDGRAIGTITQIVTEASDANRPVLIVRSAFDEQVLRVPARIADFKSGAVHVKATAAELRLRPS